MDNTYANLKLFKSNLLIILRYLKYSAITNTKLFIGSELYNWRIVTSQNLSKMFNKNSVCHILGSGYSLNNSLSVIDSSKDFVIGFNFSGLAYHYSDIYFIEIANETNDVSRAQFKLWKYLKNKFKDTIFVFKNVAEEKNSVRSINKLYKNEVLYLKDAIVCIDNSRSLNFFSDIVLGDNLFLKNQMQTISSTIVAISIAYKIGFKKIILHGVDFTGPHFYDVSSFNDSELEFIRNIISSNSTICYEEKHKTNTGIVSHEDFLLHLRGKLRKKGVFLEAAMQDSNLARLFKNCLL
ncbi:MAG: hypothetical protein EOM37_14330 [Proteobacteria bacterium]|nr:hypothetical protein [Pseudomonadota bacterium]